MKDGPSQRDELPDELLVEIGRFATDWAVIEQEVMLWASALSAEDTDGWSTEHLRMDFKRLRRRWFELAKGKLPGKVRELELINDRLARASEARGYAIHGMWTAEADGGFTVVWWEQKEKLRFFSLPTTLDDFRGVTERVRVLRTDLVFLASGTHR